MDSYVINEKEYVQKKVPDWDKLIELIEQAKGADRSMRDFAGLCEKSPATFTRIIKKSYKKPLEKSFICKIYENAAPQSGVTLEDLVRANGYAPEDDYTISDIEKVKEKINTGYGDCRDILLKEIGRRKVNFMAYTMGTSFQAGNDSVIEKMEAFETGISELTVRVEGFSVPYRVFRSCLIPKHYLFKYEDGELDYSDKDILEFMINRMANIFLLDAWKGHVPQEYAFSIVFRQEKAFDVFAKYIAELPLNHTMTAVLIDPETKSVVKEEILPGKDGKPVESIFNLPIAESGNFYPMD